MWEGDLRLCRGAGDADGRVGGGGSRRGGAGGFGIRRSWARVCLVCGLIWRLDNAGECEGEWVGGNLGRRCRGQGISPKIWGAEYAELKI